MSLCRSLADVITAGHAAALDAPPWTQAQADHTAALLNQHQTPAAA